MYFFLFTLLVISNGAFFSCSKNTTDSPPNNPPLAPTGVLLGGDTSAVADTVVYDLDPTPASESEIGDNGFMTTRLDAIISPNSTVGQVNSALDSIDAKIISMNEAKLMMTLIIPAVTSKAEADSLGEILVNSGAFLFAYGTFTANISLLPGDSRAPASISAVLPPSDTLNMQALIKMKMPAAWNVKEMAGSFGQVTVVVADEFYSESPHADIPSQVFMPTSGGVSNIANSVGFYPGNHGFHIAGIIGAKFDNLRTTGVHPGPASRLKITSLALDGLSASEISDAIASNLPTGPFILNTSLGFFGDMSVTPKLDRILTAIGWRIQLDDAGRYDNFLHIASAGNEGQNNDESRFAVWNSQFALAAGFNDPYDLIDPDSLTAFQKFRLDLLIATYTLVDPLATAKLNNIIVVGSSDTAGVESSFSNPGSPVRVLGEAVAGPCAKADNSSDPDDCRSVGGALIARYSGTSMATPLVAGLAAYMWNLKPSLTPAATKNIILHVYNTMQGGTGILNAFACCLALDDNLATAKVRKELLDVSGSTGAPGSDGVFNEKDIQLLLNKFLEFENSRPAGSNTPDYSRYDLNGNGITGDSLKKAGFDLDVNTPPQLGTVTKEVCGLSRQFNELALSDYDILMYYAFSSLFTGNIIVRNELFECAEESHFVMIIPLVNPSRTYVDNPLRSVRVGIVTGTDTVFGAYNCRLTLTGAALGSTGEPGLRVRDFFAPVSGEVSLDYFLFRDATEARLKFEVLSFGNAILYDTTLVVQGDGRDRWSGTFSGWASISGIECAPFDTPVDSAWAYFNIWFDGTRLNMTVKYYLDSLYSRDLTPNGWYGSGGGNVDPSASLSITCEMNFRNGFGTQPYLWNDGHGQINMQLNLTACSISGSITPPTIPCGDEAYTDPFSASFSSLKGDRCH